MSEERDSEWKGILHPFVSHTGRVHPLSHPFHSHTSISLLFPLSILYSLRDSGEEVR